MKIHEAMEAYWAVSVRDPGHARSDVADPLVLTLLGLVSEQRIASPARGFHLLQCLGAQLYRLNSGRHSLDEALLSLDQDREFLKAGDVFSDDLIDAYIDLKMDNVTRLRMATHPVEFDMYYSL